MRRTIALVGVLLLLLVGCSRGETGPSADRAKQDVVGQQFYYRYQWGEGGKEWTVKPGQVEDLVIQERFTDRDAQTDELHARVTLKDDAQTVRGVLVLRYKQFEQGWKLESVEPRDGGPGKSFSFDITKNQDHRDSQPHPRGR